MPAIYLYLFTRPSQAVLELALCLRSRSRRRIEDRCNWPIERTVMLVAKLT